MLRCLKDVCPISAWLRRNGIIIVSDGLCWKRRLGGRVLLGSFRWKIELFGENLPPRIMPHFVVHGVVKEFKYVALSC